MQAHAAHDFRCGGDGLHCGLARCFRQNCRGRHAAIHQIASPYLSFGKSRVATLAARGHQ